MTPAILRYQAEKRYSTEERCDINELSNGGADPDLSIAQAIVAPGVTTAWHCVVDTLERYVLISGSGRVEVGELPPAEVGVGDVVIIPPGVRQRIRNSGSGDLIFLAICSPRFAQRNYRDLSSAAPAADAADKSLD